MIRTLLLGSALLVQALPLAAQQPAAQGAAAPPVVDARRVAERAIVLDGRLTEPSWGEAPAAGDWVQTMPDAGKPATERSEARVLHDEKAIYVGIRLYDAKPDSIQSQLAARDEDVYADWAYVAFDSYHDRRSAFAFGVNPRGVKRDLMISEDTEEDPTWDAVWEVAVRTDSLGWVAEFRIPLSQLRFNQPGEGEEHRWGVNFWRQIARREETAYWAPVPRNRSKLVSAFGDLRGLQGVSAPRRLELQPYSLASVTRAPGNPGDPPQGSNALSGGADVRYGLTSDLTLTATVNPDFGQVEADPAVVNTSGYPILFSEKRPFFLEGTEIFRFKLGNAQLFNSRRIGRAPQREIQVTGGFADAPATSTLLGAAKLSGKTAGGWSVGLLSALAGAESARVVDSLGVQRFEPVEPLTHYGVARVTRDLAGGNATLGGVFTATNRRIDDDGLGFLPAAAYTGGVDSWRRFGGGNYQLSAALLGSRLEGSTEALARTQRAFGRFFQRPDASHLEYDSTRTSLTGYAAAVSLSKVAGGNWTWGVGGHAYSPGFEINDLGFLRDTDVASQFFTLSRHNYQRGKIFRYWKANFNQWSDWSFGGERTATGASFDFNFQFHNLWGGTVGADRNLSALSVEALRGGPAVVMPGESRLFLSVYSDRRRSVTGQAYFSVSREDETDVRRVLFYPTLSVRPSKRVELGLQPSLNLWASEAEYMWTAVKDGVQHPLFGRVEQAIVTLTTRLSYVFSPTLGVQLYASPYLFSREFSDYSEAAKLRADHFRDRYRTFGEDELQWDEARSLFMGHLDDDGRVDFAFRDPSFTYGQFNLNAVLNWEYRPGSTLYVIWTQDRSDHYSSPPAGFGPDMERLFGAPGTNVLLLKLSYWLGL